MPCRSDHMEPTVRERQQLEAAQHLAYVYDKLDVVVPPEVMEAANNIYDNKTDKHMKTLCALLKEASEDQRDALIYNARDPQARKLDDWWEEHQREDEISRKAEAEKNYRRVKDFLGQEVVVGDHIFYSTTGRNAESRLCIVTRFTPKTMFAKVLRGNRGGFTFTEDVAVKNDFVKVPTPRENK